MGFRGQLPIQAQIDMAENERKQQAFQNVSDSIVGFVKEKQRTKEQADKTKRQQALEIYGLAAKTGVDPKIIQENMNSFMDSQEAPKEPTMFDKLFNGSSEQPAQASQTPQDIFAPVREKQAQQAQQKQNALDLQNFQLEEYRRKQNEGSLPYEQTREGKAFVAKQKSTKDNKEISESRRKAATFATRVSEAENVFSDLSNAGFNRASNESSVQSILPNVLKPEQLIQQEQAERNFINAILRRESGAAIAPSEFTSAEKQYFPRAGDTDAVLAQKKKNREIAKVGLEAEAGDKAISEIKGKLTSIPEQIQTMTREQKIKLAKERGYK